MSLRRILEFVVIGVLSLVLAWQGIFSIFTQQHETNVRHVGLVTLQGSDAVAAGFMWVGLAALVLSVLLYRNKPLWFGCMAVSAALAGVCGLLAYRSFI